MRKPRSLSIEILLHKSSEELIDSDVALANGRFNNSVNRSYYSMFHAATAAVKTEIPDFEPSTHNAVLGNFSRYIVHLGGFNNEIASTLRELETARMVADYQEKDYGLLEAQDFNKSAHEFFAEIRRYIQLSNSLNKDSSFDTSKLSSSGLKTGAIGDILDRPSSSPSLNIDEDNDPKP
ncbi:HEPN domain-containing protein (plasmid) [Pseudomonas silesiensis]|uniref:HEPN domain-containing protein n=1 Tax=Pseudomonas silesiensis TaxID=1853130 RepID=UPI0030D533C7